MTQKARALVSSKRELFWIKTLAHLKGFKAENCLLINSEPRSGSTWLLDLLQKHSDFASIWEPFHPQNHRGLISLDEYPEKILHQTPSSKNEKLKTRLDRIFQSQILNNWSTLHTDWKQVLRAKYLLLKTVRGSLIVPWILENWQFKFKVIHLIRHPIAVAYSQEKNFFAKQENPSSFLNVPFVHPYAKQRELLKNCSSIFEKIIIQWCIHFQYMQQCSPEAVHTIYYENLVLNPKKELSYLAQEQSPGFKLAPFQDPDYRRASFTDYQQDMRSNPLEQLNKWQNMPLSKLDKAQKLLDYFGIRLYHSKNPYPQDHEK